MALIRRVSPDSPDDASLVLAAEVLQAGGLIVYPTETLYGIGANAFNVRAVRRIRELKRREDAKPILLIIPGEPQLASLTAEVPDVARNLMANFWPGPLTLVFRALPSVPEEITMGTGTVGVRVPASTLCLRLLSMVDWPVTSTSANISGEPSPETAAAIQKSFPSGIDLFLDAGSVGGRKPSTVVDVSGGRVRLIRAGEVPVQRLREVVDDLEA